MKTTIDFVRSGAIYKVPENYFFINGVYLSGELKKEAGEELCASSINLLFEEEGMYDATFNGQEGFILYLWKIESKSGDLINRGLVCNAEDVVSCTEAKIKFNNKAILI